MKKILLSAMLIAFPFLLNAQVEDGLYVLNDMPTQYFVLLSDDEVVNAYGFSIKPGETKWNEARGSQVDENKIRLADSGVGGERIKIFEIVGDRGNTIFKRVACTEYPDGNKSCLGGIPNEGTGVSLLMPANGQLKGIYVTQWGARFVIFESNDIVVALLFEFENTLSEQNIVSAYTAKIDSTLRISNIVEVVPPSNDDDELRFTMEWQISDYDNPQFEMLISDCSRAGAKIDCAELEPNRAYVTRVF